MRQLRSAGFMPDVIICRSDKDLDKVGGPQYSRRLGGPQYSRRSAWGLRVHGVLLRGRVPSQLWAVLLRAAAWPRRCCGGTNALVYSRTGALWLHARP